MTNEQADSHNDSWVVERPSWVRHESPVRVKLRHQQKTVWIQFVQRDDGTWLAYQFGRLIPVHLNAIEAYWDHDVMADYLDFGD